MLVTIDIFDTKLTILAQKDKIVKQNKATTNRYKLSSIKIYFVSSENWDYCKGLNDNYLLWVVMADKNVLMSTS